jgi:PST family polysaccharide transporter
MVTVSVTTSIVQATAMTIFAKPIATALGSPAAAGPIKVMALVVIIIGVFTVPSAQLTRNFKQDKIFLAEVMSFAASTVVLLLLARSGSGAMAFAWSRVVGQLVSGCVVLAAVSKTYPPGMSRNALRLLLKFGLPLGGAGFINCILLNVDYALIGHLLGTVALGTYVLAFNVASWPASLFGAMINHISIPAFSRVKHDADLFRASMTSAVGAISLVVMPMSALTIALADPLVLTLYGAKWAASAEVLQVLSIYGAIAIICVLFANVLAGLGRTSWLFIVQLIWLGALIPAMVLGVRTDGIVGAAVAHIAVIVPVVLPAYLYVLKRTTGISLTAIARAMLPAVLASSVAALAAKEVAQQFVYPLVQLISGLAIGGIIYVVAAAPQLVALLNRGRTARLPVERILWLHYAIGRPLGLGRQPKHAAKVYRRSVQQMYQPGPRLGVPGPVLPLVGQTPSAGLNLLMSLSTPVPHRTPARRQRSARRPS